MKAWAIAIFLLAALGFAQAAGQRKPAAPAEDFSGMYSFLDEGEFVQINVEDGNRLTGFISRYSDGQKALFVDHFFEKAELHDRVISFTTRKVHGVWFEFTGAVLRGPGKTRDVEAYYVIKGTLTQYTSDANQVVSGKAREVTFRSFPQELEDEPAAKAGGTQH